MKRLLRKLLGDRGEQAAARYLRQHGYRILQRGYRNPFGEVDLIALFERRIIFIEVKTRSSDRTSSASCPTISMTSGSTISRHPSGLKLQFKKMQPSPVLADFTLHA